MTKLLSALEAQQITAGVDKRKDEIRELANFEISTAAKNGMKICSIPPKLSSAEKNWLIDELVLAGYSAVNGMSMISWQ